MMNRIRTAELIISTLDLKSMPQGAFPEMAFIGRSNVGKSSLINALLARRALARVSSEPGKTRLMNFYLIDDSFHLVDVPGYGYAKFSQAERATTRRRLQDYLLNREQLKVVVQLVDIRHEPSVDDVDFSLLVRQAGVPLRIVATKADKIPRSRLAEHRKLICGALSCPASELSVTSAEDKQGVSELWASLVKTMCIQYS